jgi:hypothetical protein
MLASIDVNNLSVFAEAGLVIFLAVFVAVTLRAVRAPRQEMTSCARMPLDEPDTAGEAANNGGGAR